LIRQIVCGLDVLRPSRAAIRHAFELAERFNALLDVVYAQPPSLSALVGVRSQREAGVSSHERLRKAIASVVTPIQGRASLHIVTDHAVHGILEHAERTKSDLIVLGSCPDEIPDEQRSRVADRLVQQTSRAVLTSNEWAWADPPGIARILLPVGLAAFSARTAEWAATLAWRFDGRIELFHVLPETTDDVSPSAAQARAQALLQRWQEQLNARGAVVSRLTVGQGDVASRIIERAESTRADLVLMESPAVTPPWPHDVVAAVRRETGARVLSLKLDPN
jgi:nucleotide-binding universal stress UspA family protein